jgi:hypothetical protein
MAEIWGAAIAAVGAVGGAYLNSKKKSSSSTSEQMPQWYDDAAQAAGTRANDIMNRQYSEYTGNRIAGLGANEQAAYSAAGSLSDKTSPFMSRLQAGFTPGALSQFSNPYTDSVLGARTRAIGEEYGRQSSALSNNQAAMDAFRTGRSDLARSRLDANRIRALDEATNQTKSDAWDKALSAYNAQNQTDIGALGATTNSELGRIGALSSTGAAERGVRQSQNDFNYGQFLERRDWDVNNLGPMLQFLQSTKTGGTSTTTASAPSNLGGLLGGVATVAGQYLQNTGGSYGGSNGNPDPYVMPTDDQMLQPVNSQGALNDAQSSYQPLPQSAFGS